jgi:hypothetical protein
MQDRPGLLLRNEPDGAIFTTATSLPPREGLASSAPSVITET